MKQLTEKQIERNRANTRAAAGFLALGNGDRLQIFRILLGAGGKGLSVQQLIAKVDTQTGLIPSRSTLTVHFKILSRAGLITQHPKGPTLVTVADYTPIEPLIKFLEMEFGSKVAPPANAQEVKPSSS